MYATLASLLINSLTASEKANVLPIYKTEITISQSIFGKKTETVYKIVTDNREVINDYAIPSSDLRTLAIAAESSAYWQAETETARTRYTNAERNTLYYCGAVFIVTFLLTR